MIMEIKMEEDFRRMRCAVLLHGTASYNVIRIEIIFLIWYVKDFLVTPVRMIPVQ